MTTQGEAARLTSQAAGLNVAALWRQQVARSPGQVALQQGDRQLRYAELDQRVRRLANGIRAHGVQRGDRVAVLAENRLEYIELELAAALLGVILACQNWRQADEELLHCIRLVSPRMVFVSARYADTLARLAHDVPTVIELETEYEPLLAAAPDTRQQEDPEPEDGLIILYTSGTTGLPKGALISHRAMIARSMISRADGLQAPGDTFIAWAPLCHMVSTDSVYGLLTSGGKVIVMDEPDADQIVALSASEKIGHLTLIPGMVERVIEAARRATVGPLAARTLGCMADLVPAAQIAEVTRLFNAPFLNSFGSTETGAAPASRHLIPVGELPHSLSKWQNSHCVVRLVDADGGEVPDGSPGELAMRGPSLFSGYWGAPEATAKDFRDGWFHMGDVFVRNPDRSLDYVDRRKYLIKSGGENIYPAEIERVLLAWDRIADAVVVRRADARWGETPVAFVVKADASLTGEQVVAHCRGRIADYKLPKSVIFIDAADVPRSTTGKVKRHELEARLAAS